jgi:hypothetical protein
MSHQKCTTSEVNKEFSCISQSLQCHNESEDSEEAIVERNTMKHQKTSNDQETNEENRTKCERVTKQDAMKFIARLRLYFIQEGNEGSSTSAIKTCTDFVNC